MVVDEYLSTYWQGVIQAKAFISTNQSAKLFSCQVASPEALILIGTVMDIYGSSANDF